MKRTKDKLGRRGFLKIGAGAAAAALANPTESIAQPRPAQAPLQVRGECNDVAFAEPTPVHAEIIDRKSVLKYELNAEKLEWVCPGDPKRKPGLQPVFNGAIPGPTLYVDPGTSINLTLHNRLDKMPEFSKMPESSDENCHDGHTKDPTKPGCFQHTNLHFHGLQVSPCSIAEDGKLHYGPYEIREGNARLQYSSDDVLVNIFPGESNEYRVVLPDMHAPGTNWYHSHLHGASAYQVSGGMAGALIIREPTEEARIVRQDLDKVFVLQEILLNPLPPNWPAFPPVYGTQPIGGGKGSPATQIFVNGLCRPTLRMKKGQMMRWRFINAGVTPKALMTLRLIKRDTCSKDFPDEVPKGELMHLIAIDGISFYGINPQPVRYHLLGLGNRADFLVKFDKAGVYTLLKDGYPLESVTKPESTNYTFASGKGNRQVLLYVHVEESDYEDQIPAVIPGKRPAYLLPIRNVNNPPDRVRPEPIKFQNMSKAKFQIDDAFYGAANQKPIEVQLNTAEEWTLQNWADAKTPTDKDRVPQANTHPFHVHLNPFQICGVLFDFEVEDDDLPKGVKRLEKANACHWPFWDTVPLPGADNPKSSEKSGELTIRSRFLIYDGEYVTHCHILIHEDVGMMINVRLIGNGIGPGLAVHDYPPDARACIERTCKPSDKKCGSPTKT